MVVVGGVKQPKKTIFYPLSIIFNVEETGESLLSFTSQQHQSLPFLSVEMNTTTVTTKKKLLGSLYQRNYSVLKTFPWEKTWLGFLSYKSGNSF